jgi:hypothetical protein
MIGPTPVPLPIDGDGHVTPPGDARDLVPLPTPGSERTDCSLVQDETLCPPLAPGGASCSATSALVRETDPASINAAYTISHTTTTSTPGEAEEKNHADIQHIALSVGGFDILADVLYAECSSSADGPRVADGRAGVLDLRIDSGGVPFVGAKALEFGVYAESDAVTQAVPTCMQAFVLVPIASTGLCTPANTAIAGPGFVLVLNEQWGPVQNAAGQWTYGGAALHLSLVGPTGIVTAEVFIGAVAVAVDGPAPSGSPVDGDALPPLFASVARAVAL